MDLSKIDYVMFAVGVIAILAGAGLLALFINTIVQLFKSNKKDNVVKYPIKPTFKCPHCGKNIQI